jgi:hypothetical protein
VATLTVDAACSKHCREDTLPVHPELVILVRQWIAGMDADTLLFPRLESKKTWLMVKKDLERIGIPYDTPEGIADFHAAGRHSHITGLLRNGVTLVEARELARHADVRMTMKYTHIGLDDQAKVLAGLPAPFASKISGGSGIGRDSGGALRQELSADDSDDDDDDLSGNEKTPSLEGVSSLLGTFSQELSVAVSSGGGGNCTRVPNCASCFATYELRQARVPVVALCLRLRGATAAYRELAFADAGDHGEDHGLGAGQELTARVEYRLFLSYRGSAC